MSRDAWRNIDRFLAAHRIRVGAPTLGQTTGGAHKPNSFHYQGRARDYGRSSSDLRAILEILGPYALGADPIIEELFGLNTYADGGRLINPSKQLWASHQDHVHVALRAGRTLPIPADDQEDTVPDNPDLPNIEGPLSFHVVANSDGEVRGYYIFSISTGELHTFGSVPYLNRSEDLTPD